MPHPLFLSRFNVAIIAWELLAEEELLDEGIQISHFLWALHFLKCYPKTEQGCAAAASKKGAVDPKTWRKYIWPIIYSLSDLESAVVSSFCDIFLMEVSF